MSDENRLVDWLRSLDPAGPIGDDAALVTGVGDLALTVDHQIEGVHFVRGMPPELVARRLLAVNLSDLAAVGATPRWALLAFAAPRGFDRRRILEPLVEACRRYGVVLAGGDLAASERLHLSLTLVGVRPARGHWLRRDGARVGDRLWISGVLGASALGRALIARGARVGSRGIALPTGLRLAPRLRRAAREAVRHHLEPAPALELGQALGRRRRVAAIDVSDGLSRDLDRLCRASGVGALVDSESLPVAEGHTELALALGEDPLLLALHGGEDYALLFSLPANAKPPREGPPARPLGRFVRGTGARLSREGRAWPLRPAGWDHLTPA